VAEDLKNPKSETITFELIRKIQREEQRLPKLTRLPDDFYNNTRLYLENKRKAAEANRKVGLEVKNIERLVEDVFNRRERKIFNLALIAARTGIPPENLTAEEKDFFDSIAGVVKSRRAVVLDGLLEKEGARRETAALVIFSEDVPEFMGSDMKAYGPFKKGDIAKLPEENMRVVVDQGVAKEFRIEK
jgi:DNA replication factor GINS